LGGKNVAWASGHGEYDKAVWFLVGEETVMAALRFALALTSVLLIGGTLVVGMVWGARMNPAYIAVCMVALAMVFLVLVLSFFITRLDRAGKESSARGNKPPETEDPFLFDEVFFISGTGFWRAKVPFWIIAIQSFCLLFAGTVWPLGVAMLACLMVMAGMSLTFWEKREQIRKAGEERRRRERAERSRG
jgi:hypothetical protein